MTCLVFRYKAFRDENGKYTLVYWELLAVRLGFIIAFEVIIDLPPANHITVIFLFEFELPSIHCDQFKVDMKLKLTLFTLGDNVNFSLKFQPLYIYFLTK